MGLPSYIVAESGGCLLTIKAQPRARSTAFAGMHGSALKIRIASPPVKRAAITPTFAVKPADLENEWTYLRKVIRGEVAVDALSSLENNVIVVEILDAARAAVAKVRSAHGEAKAPEPTKAPAR